MESEHRKVELQSPADLTYLTTQLRTAAAQKLDLHLPPAPDTSEPDELRQKVSSLVDAFVAQVLAGMRDNISINGMDVSSSGGGGGGTDDEVAVSKEEFEPYDEALRQRLADTIRRRDQLIGQISKHRRATPATAAQRWKDGFEREMAGLEKLVVESEAAAKEVRQEDMVDVEELKRGEEISRNWERAVEGLGSLRGGLPETRARLERAVGVVGYLEGKEAKSAV